MKTSPTSRENNIDWNHVFYFSEVAAHGSIKNAAPKLHLSPSTLSTHISQLEKDLAIKLFHRRHRKLSLTAEGVKLYQYAKQMFESGCRLIDVVSPVSLGHYPISIGLVPCPSMPVAYRIVTNYLTKYDPVNIRVSQAKHDELEKGLAEARFDFGFSNRVPDRKDIGHLLVARSALKFFVAKNIANESFSTLCSKLPIVICGAESRGLDLVEQLFEDLALKPKSIVTSDYPGLVLDLCLKERAIGVFGEDSIQNLNLDILCPLPYPERSSNRFDSLYVLWPKDSENSKAIQFLKAQLPTFNKEF
ncbi:MAG TPA: LysR family transcriptional regulator [Oligoflexia bacterium]|nr:LysR family transcriptional regulator [Oligoflexia bacterium]